MPTHGKNVVFILYSSDATPTEYDLSQYSDNVDWNRSQDTSETTCYGQTAKTYVAGHTDGTFTVGGKFDAGTSGPQDVIEANGLDAELHDFIIREAGTGEGLPEKSGSALVTTYSESMPVAGVITWSADFQLSGTVTTSAQSA
ncbi:hypothetical protein [Actinospongicola halichondriae]|uniref:hypothetical protein n=1 Tax=Actinospongicola halichondriae TaxID=3236844 RepID=UPI003D59B92A